jgi:tetratricopeptide (TPR) repeat protein
MRAHVALEEIDRLLPRLEELEGLRGGLTTAAVPDPQKEWASSRAYATIDKRVLTCEVVERTLDEAEAAVKEQVSTLFGGLRALVKHHWRGEEAAAAQDLISLGEAEESRSQFVRARTLYCAALTASLPLADKSPQILALRRIARALFNEGQLNDGREYYARSAELARAAGEVRSEIIARTGIGNVLVFQGRWAEATAAYQSALLLLETANGSAYALERGHLYNNLGMVHVRTGELDEAEKWLSLGRELWSRLDSPVDSAIWGHVMGLLRTQQGQLDEARDVLLRAIALPVPPTIRSVIATDLSDLYLREGLLTQAEQWGREAETYAIASGSPYQISHMYAGLGNIARARGDDGGITFFEKAVETARVNGQGIAEGEALTDYALLRASMGQPDEAQAYLERAREIFVELGAAHDLARVEEALESIAPAPPLAAAGD